MDAELQEMLSLFQDESLELLDNMEESLLAVQDDGFDDDNINAVFRAVHTVKGGAGMLQLEQLIDFTHKAENILDKIRSKQIPLTDDIISLFLEIKDHLVNLVNAVVSQEGQENYPQELVETTNEYKQILSQIESGSESDGEKVFDGLEFVDDNDESDSEGDNESDDEGKNEKVFDGLEFVDDDKVVSQEEIENLIKLANDKNDIDEINKKNTIKKKIEINKTEDKDKKLSTSSVNVKQVTLKVDAYKIDTLINIVGEVVIANANVIQNALRINDKALSESIDVLSRMVEELREATMQTRMIPINDTFIRFKRVVRDLSNKLGKKIEMIIEGGETELDKTVIEKISDPLIHLIRNSIDHGLETVQERKAKGKSPKGLLKLKAFHEAGSIAIQVIDDGRGINTDIIFNKAVEKGIVTKDDKLSKKEIFELIFHPGFSTAEQVSDISGRGVGMDVVRRNIEELRGAIDIDSEIGVGTTITIRLPLTLAIIDGFMVTITNEPYIIPLEMIIECIELSDEFKEFIKENSYINLRGHVLALLDLRDFFNYNKTKHKRENIVIVRFGAIRIGLIVDELKGEFQTVIKPLGKVFKNLRGISGVTILGDGRICPILDIPVLINEQIRISNSRSNYRS